MSKTTSVSNKDVDIFDRLKIKLATHDEYAQLNRFSFIERNDDGYYMYVDNYTKKLFKSLYLLPTLDNYKEFVIIVY